MSYSKVARRIRVPLGFVFAAVYLWLARPTWALLAAGAAVAALGIAVRAAAAGHVRKNAELTTTGPYAYTRNPLYLGSILIAIGFAVAARNVVIAVMVLAMFAAIYVPVIRSEEEYLRAKFPEFDAYAARVPRLAPNPLRRRSTAPGDERGFSRELYWKHREYNALIGALLMMAALAAKILLQAKALH